jgi:hypothetical protein
MHVSREKKTGINMKNIPHVRNQTISRKLRIFFLYILGNSFFYAPIIVFPLGGVRATQGTLTTL